MLRRFLGLMMLLSVITNAYGSVLDDVFPRGVTIGLSIEKVQSLRPNAHSSPSVLLPRLKKGNNAVEMVERESPTIFYIYAFRNDILRAMVKSCPVVDGITPSMDPQHLITSLKLDFVFERSDKIARASRGLKHYSVTADLWSDPDSGLKAYLVSTSDETTVIVFDPTDLGAEDFFVAAEKIPELEKGASAIRAIAESDKNNSQPIIDRPWDDKSAASDEISLPPSEGSNHTQPPPELPAKPSEGNGTPVAMSPTPGRPFSKLIIVALGASAIGLSVGVFLMLLKRR